MSACIGWKAEPCCPVYGDHHGCKLDDGHNDGGAHVCECGATTRTRDLPIERRWTGNPGGWMRARRAREATG